MILYGERLLVLRSPTSCAIVRTAKEDFELHGKRIKKGTVILASLMYAKACDPRISGGDHVDSPLPAHMDISRPLDSFKPERWLDDANKLDSSVRLSGPPQILGNNTSGTIRYWHQVLKCFTILSPASKVCLTPRPVLCRGHKFPIMCLPVRLGTDFTFLLQASY